MCLAREPKQDPEHCSSDQNMLPTSAQGHQKLLPAFGVVHPLVHQFACATGAPNHPDAEALVDAIPCWDSELAVALCSELAEHPGFQAGFPEYLKRLKLPTNSGKFCPLETVYINDAQWKGAGGVQTLDDRISHDHGRKLGCKSVRERLKQECEDGAEDEDAFGQEADLVDQAGFVKAFPLEIHAYAMRSSACIFRQQVRCQSVLSVRDVPKFISCLATCTLRDLSWHLTRRPIIYL